MHKIEFLTDLCNWCNTNEGVVSALLTVLTIIISVIALFVSIKLGKMEKYIDLKKDIQWDRKHWKRKCQLWRKS